MSQELQKKCAAEAALAYLEEDMVVGVGTGSTVNYFIEGLVAFKHKIEAAVASSEQTAQLLQQHGIRVLDLNVVDAVPLYIDGADEINNLKQMVKGGGGALTREKILATAAKKFVCIVDTNKQVKRLGEFPVAVEVIPMARSMVARKLVMLGGDPQYRDGFVSDNGNIILDVFNLNINEPIKLEQELKAITGVVDSGLFAQRPADVLIVGTDNGVQTY